MNVGRLGRAGVVALAIGVGLVGVHFGNYALNLLTVVFVYAIAVVGLDLINGFAGLLSLGQGGFFGIGAYTVAIGAMHSGLPGVALITIGVLAAAAAAAPIAFVVSGRGQTVSALVTLAFGLITSSIIGGLTLTGGPTGLPVEPGALFPGLTMTPGTTYVVAWMFLVVAVFLLYVMRIGSGGRALAACRHDGRLAAACAVNVKAHRGMAFVIGSALAAVGGGLFAYAELFVSPTSVGLTQSVEFLMMLVIGGAGTGWGSLIGALLVVGLPSEVQSLGNLQLLGTGAISLAVLIWFRRGIAGSLEYWFSYWRRKRGRLRRRSSIPSESAVAGLRRPLPLTAGDGLLAARGLVRRFSGVIAVDDMEIDLNVGEIHGLIGPNGAGKSTMLNLLSGADIPDGGTIAFRGGDLTAVPAHVRARSGIARTFQHATLVPVLTTLENVLLGAHAHVERRIISAAARATGVPYAIPLEDEARAVLWEIGLGEVADEPSHVLTAGQRRLAEVARCVMSRGCALLLDEPAAGLNETETAHLGQVLTDLVAAGRAILLVEHDMSLVMSVSTRVTVMDRGAPLESGTPEAIVGSDVVAEAYLGG